MLSYLNVVIVKIPFRLRVMGFSSNRLLFLFSWEGAFRLETVVLGTIEATPESTSRRSLVRKCTY